MSAAAQQAVLGQYGQHTRPTGAIQSSWWEVAQQVFLQPWRLQRLASRQDNPLRWPGQKDGNRREQDGDL